MPSNFLDEEYIAGVETLMNRNQRKLTPSIKEAVNAEINFIFRWLADTYSRAKPRGDKHQLYKLILPKVNALGHFLVTYLGDVEYRYALMGVYALASSLHLLLLQELIVVNPACYKPDQSLDIAKVSSCAQRYTSHVQHTYEHLTAKCSLGVTKVVMEYQVVPVSSREKEARSRVNYISSQVTYTTRWTDSSMKKTFTDQTERISGVWTNGTLAELEERSIAARTAHVSRLAALTGAGASLDRWRQLIYEPLTY